MVNATSLLLVGCGKMGSAMVSGWHHAGFTHIDVIEPFDLAPGIQDLIHTHARKANMLPRGVYDAVILAIKPQQLDDACASLRPFIGPETLVLSIAAGRTVTGISKHFTPTQPIIRAMPNLPASIGRGITGAFANAHVNMITRLMGKSLLTAIGECVWVDNEELLDAVTAVSGSGPAYIFLLTEAMAKVGVDLGLPAPLAMQLARQTVIGAAALMDADAQTPVATLRENVTSKGGTTAVALEVLMGNDGLQPLMHRALTAARDRAKELSK